MEDFRQKTPHTIVEIAKILLDAGADVNAGSDAYGGNSTTLMLTATSGHPEKAGVQLALMELLIERGAVIEGPEGRGAVNTCLYNGRGEAAVFLAGCGARLDLEAAAGVGRLDIVEGFFNADGRLKPTATQEQVRDAFAWACQFGQTHIVRFLLEHGVNVGIQPLRHHGQTGLHWAALRGEAATVRLLLERKAPVDARDEKYRTTPLSWALYGWGNEHGATPPGGYHDVVAQLVAAGAQIEADWLADRKVCSDPRMLACLAHPPTADTAPPASQSTSE